LGKFDLKVCTRVKFTDQDLRGLRHSGVPHLHAYARSRRKVRTNEGRGDQPDGARNGTDTNVTVAFSPLDTVSSTQIDGGQPNCIAGTGGPDLEIPDWQ
jgi:hypothetical protein